MTIDKEEATLCPQLLDECRAILLDEAIKAAQEWRRDEEVRGVRKLMNKIVSILQSTRRARRGRPTYYVWQSPKEG